MVHKQLKSQVRSDDIAHLESLLWPQLPLCGVVDIELVDDRQQIVDFRIAQRAFNQKETILVKGLLLLVRQFYRAIGQIQSPVK